jgi:hypothetical protein
MSHRDEPVSPEPAALDPASDLVSPPPRDEPAAAPTAGAPPADSAGTGPAPPPSNMLPGRERRRFRIERLLVRLIATCGIVGIGVALGAILVSSKVQGWIIGLVIALVTVLLSALLWSSRQL